MPAMWEKHLQSSALPPPCWLGDPPGSANVFESYGGFMLWINVQCLLGRRHPIHFALSPDLVYNLPLQRQNAY